VIPGEIYKNGFAFAFQFTSKSVHSLNYTMGRVEIAFGLSKTVRSGTRC